MKVMKWRPITGSDLFLLTGTTIVGFAAGEPIFRVSKPQWILSASLILATVAVVIFILICRMIGVGLTKLWSKLATTFPEEPASIFSLLGLYYGVSIYALVETKGQHFVSFLVALVVLFFYLYIRAKKTTPRIVH